MSNRWKGLPAASAARLDERQLTNAPLFVEEDFSGGLQGMLPGHMLPRHCYAHEHEVFDVLAGTGTQWLCRQ
jgi:oxalate decarboxylase/phosphoglucose isomerase-like protein (cupin superfamily)